METAVAVVVDGTVAGIALFRNDWIDFREEIDSVLKTVATDFVDLFPANASTAMHSKFEYFELFANFSFRLWYCWKHFGLDFAAVGSDSNNSKWKFECVFFYFDTIRIPIAKLPLSQQDLYPYLRKRCDHCQVK